MTVDRKRLRELLRELTTPALLAATPEYAEAMGRDYVLSGANTTNCNFRLFATPELTRAWERGRNAAIAEQEGRT